MPSGIDQGGAGQRVFVYDDSSPWLDAAMTVPRTPGPYIFPDELIAAGAAGVINPGDIEQLLGPFSGSPFTYRVQAVSHVPVRVGGADSDGTAPTTIRMTDADLYFDNTNALEYRTVGYGANLLRTELGTKRSLEFGSYRDIIGANGATLFATNSMILRGNFAIYGSMIGTYVGNVGFLDSGASFAEVCGNTILPNAPITLGNNGTPQLIAQNNYILTAPSSSAPIQSMSVLDAKGTVVSAIGHSTFLLSGTANQRFSRMRLMGAPASRDLTWLGSSARDWDLVDFGWSQTVGKPKMGDVGPAIPLGDSAEEWKYFNTKVCEQSQGAPLIDIPVMLSSSLDGLLINTKTFGDGDIGFTDAGLSGETNMVKVRDHYNPVAGVANYTVLDRYFTLVVNGYGGAFPPNQSYETKIEVFQWPGRDTFRGAYQLGGGIFQNLVMAIALRPGTPSTRAVYNACEVMS